MSPPNSKSVQVLPAVLLGIVALCVFAGLMYFVLAWKSSTKIPSALDPSVVPKADLEILATGDVMKSPVLELSPSDWPWWRGPSSNNHAAVSSAPVLKDLEGEAVWKVSVPGIGYSTPSVWGRSVYLTSCNESAEEQYVLAFDCQDGSRLWQTTIYNGKLGSKHPKNSYATSSPACDGERVFACHPSQGSLYVTAVDVSGVVSWSTCVGPYLAQHNFASSPTLYRSLVIIAVESDSNPYVAAVDRESGALVWRIVLRESTPSYGSPVIARLAGQDHLLLSTVGAVVSYDPAHGKLLWSYPWGSRNSPGTASFDGDRVFASSTSYGEHRILCLRLGENGSPWKPNEIWRDNRGSSHVPSPLVANGKIYLLGDKGVMHCRRVLDGREIWKRRLGGNFSSSPLLADGKIYVANEDGRFFLIEEGETYRLLGTHDFGEPIFASPIVIPGRMFIRTASSLIGIGCADHSSATSGGNRLLDSGKP